MSEDQFMGNLYQRFPVTIERGEGAHVWDTEGKEYIEFTTKNKRKELTTGSNCSSISVDSDENSEESSEKNSEGDSLEIRKL